jgi:hypothetical protein
MSDVINQIAEQQFVAFARAATDLVDEAAGLGHDITCKWEYGDFIIIQNKCKNTFRRGDIVSVGQLQVAVNNIRNLTRGIPA